MQSPKNRIAHLVLTEQDAESTATTFYDLTRAKLAELYPDHTAEDIEAVLIAYSFAIETAQQELEKHGVSAWPALSTEECVRLVELLRVAEIRTEEN